MLLFLHVTCSCIALFLFSLASLLLCFCFVSLSFFSFWLWHPKNLFLLRTRSLVMVLLLLLLLLFLLEISSMIQNPKRILMRTLVKGWFTQNAMSFCLIFQTLLYLGHRAFSSQGWKSLYEKLSKCPNVFIQEFYSNIHAIDTSVSQFTRSLFLRHYMYPE